MYLKIKPITYSLDTSGFDKHLRELKVKLQSVVDEFTELAKELSQSYIPEDQGVARASHYTVTSKGSTRDQAIAEAQSEAATQPSKWGNQGREVKFDSEEQELREFHGFICVAVVYGLELEFGYSSGSLNVKADNPGAQRPFLSVAMDEMEEPFIKACVEIFRTMR